MLPVKNFYRPDEVAAFLGSNSEVAPGESPEKVWKWPLNLFRGRFHRTILLFLGWTQALHQLKPC